MRKAAAEVEILVGINTVFRFQVKRLFSCALDKEDLIIVFSEERCELVDGDFAGPEEEDTHRVLVRGKPSLPIFCQRLTPLCGDGVLKQLIPLRPLRGPETAMGNLGNIVLQGKAGKAFGAFRHEPDAHVGPFFFLLIRKIDVADDDDR